MDFPDNPDNPSAPEPESDGEPEARPVRTFAEMREFELRLAGYDPSDEKFDPSAIHDLTFPRR